MSGGPAREMHSLAEEVEDADFAGLWITESGRTAYAACTAAALATKNLDLGTGIADAFPRSPMVTAQAAWELQEATGGRFVLGLGTQVKGHIERRYGSEFARPGPRIREYVLVLKAIFKAFRGEEKLDFEGGFTGHAATGDVVAGADRRSRPAGVPRGRQPVDVPGHRRGRRRDPRPSAPFAALPRRGREPNIEEGAGRAGRGASESPSCVPCLTIVVDGRRSRPSGASAPVSSSPSTGRRARTPASSSARLARHIGEAA